MAKARVRLPKSLGDLLRNDWEEVILQANLGIEDTQIAKLYLLDAIPQTDIGAKLGLTRSAISRRLPKILAKVERTVQKLEIM